MSARRVCTDGSSSRPLRTRSSPVPSRVIGWTRAIVVPKSLVNRPIARVVELLPPAPVNDGSLAEQRPSE